ncbi:hypothetical protein CERSUDRAFT_52683 [Gelatoporia subvermispora B]|uniref:Alpha/beta hydrolase fold-3 domain-containing protein n=1 Tax=Ceriporiopsis subvermispora (strain B) TaxID=914234 RepID=M2RBD3_CERS8|nr:hypothetical protein CERSUDRAFT_52683 [Gelatoporia subvermispora B]
MSQHTQLSEPDPEFSAQLSRLLQTSSADLDIQAVREFFSQDVRRRNEANFGHRLPPENAYRARDYRAAVQGGEIAVRSYTPVVEGDEATFPLFYWIHGGGKQRNVGWQIGNLETDDDFLRILCAQFRIVIVNVNYRLVPEHKWPTNLNDAYAGLLWARFYASRLAASLSKGFIVGGMSSGANMAAVIAHRARDDPVLSSSPLTGQMLGIPLVVHPDAYPEKFRDKLLSLEENKDAPILSKQGLWKWYRDYCINPTEPEISPLLYASHKGLPPTYIQVCGGDPLRDEGILYEQVLRKDGVRTKIDM